MSRDLLLFVENEYRGGLDTFVATLLNEWPDKKCNRVVLVNEDHSGIDNIKQRLNAGCGVVVTHSIFRWPRFRRDMEASGVPKAVARALYPLRLMSLLISFFQTIQVLSKYKNYELLIVNGGYPGGDLYRIASIAWFLMHCTKRRSFHNYHNLAVRPRNFERVLENVLDWFTSIATYKFIAVSDACSKSLMNRPFIENRKNTYIYNGLVDTVDISPQTIADPIEIQILMLGTFEPRKGHLFLLESCEHLILSGCINWRLTIAGHGSEKEIERVNSEINRRGLSAYVKTCSFVSNVGKLIAEAQIICVPSVAFESFGLVALEGMIFGKPVICSNVGGLPEVVHDNVSGYVIPVNDSEEFCKCMKVLIGSKELRDSMGREGRKRYLAFFTAEKMANNYYNLMKNQCP